MFSCATCRSSRHAHVHRMSPAFVEEGGTVSAHHSSQAEVTTAFLQRAAQINQPVMIPGAFEKRVEALTPPAAASLTPEAGPGGQSVNAADHSRRVRRPVRDVGSD